MKSHIVTSIVVFILVSCASESPKLQDATVSPTMPFTLPTPIQSYNIRASNGNVFLDFALSPDGTHLAVYTNQEVYVYDIKTKSKFVIEKFDNNNYVYYRAGAIAFSPDGAKIALSGKFADQPIRIWDINLKKWAGTLLDIPNGYYVTEIEFNPSGNRIITRNTYLSSIHCEGAEDKLVLYDINKAITVDDWRYGDIYSMDGCSIVPIKFRFTSNERLFLRIGGMSSKYSIFFVDSNTGQLLSKDVYDMEQDGYFYDISTNGQAVAIGDSQGTTSISITKTKEIIEVVKSEVVLLDNEKHFLEQNFNTRKWKYWENGEPKCDYGEIQQSEFKASRDGSVFGIFIPTKHELQLWNAPECAMIDLLNFDE